MRIPSRSILWLTLVLLVGCMFGLLIWLAGRYEEDKAQQQLDLHAQLVAEDIRSSLITQMQSLQVLQNFGSNPKLWQVTAEQYLQDYRELVRIEWLGQDFSTRNMVQNKSQAAVYQNYTRNQFLNEIKAACANASKQKSPSFTSSYFIPIGNGRGLEAMDLCLPQQDGFLIVNYALQNLLSQHAGTSLSQQQVLSLTEADGTRLASIGNTRASKGGLISQNLVDLPGVALVLRVQAPKRVPDFFPNMLTALVTLLSLGLLSVLFLLRQDMRKRLQAEQGLSEALAFRKAMENSLITGLRARDLQGRIRYVNPAFCDLVGFQESQLLGKGSPAPYWPPEMIDEYTQRQAVRLAGHAAPRLAYESVFMHQSGRRFPVLIIEAPLLDAQGVQTGWMSAFVDLSEQKANEERNRAAEERLQSAARLATMGEMASLMSHELNQPLAAISSYASGSLNLLQQSADASSQDIHQAMAQIATQAARAGRVIQSVQDFVKSRENQFSAVAPAQLFHAIMPLVQLQASENQVRIDLHCPPDLPQVWCHPTLIEQVLLNLARNGLQAMRGNQPEAGEHRILQLSAVLSGQATTRQWIEFSVADQGHGIPPEVGTQLFTPFFTTKLDGMGMGLNMCRTVVEQHGSALQFKAQSPRGTIFSFKLAVAALSENASALQSEATKHENE